MGYLKTIKELKEAIKDLPDDMELQGYDGGDMPCNISWWILDGKECGDIDDDKKIFTISTD